MPVSTQTRFDGSDYDHLRDAKRLHGQLGRICGIVKDGRWHTLADLAQKTGDPEASISAQLRHLRKPRFGYYTIEKRRCPNSRYEYRLVVGAPISASPLEEVEPCLENC